MGNSSFMLGNWLFTFSGWWLPGLTIVLTLALPFAIVAGWRRLYPRSPARASLVVLLNVLAFVALFLLLTEPRREHLTDQNIILITEGSDLAVAPISTVEQLYIAPDALPDPIEAKAMANANWLLDVGQLSLREPALSTVEVHGFGLTRTQWQAIPDDVQINFASPSLIGFTHMRWPRTLMMGETLVIRGKYADRQTDSIIDIRAIDPAGNLAAESRIRSGEPFILHVRPKSQGNTLYRLQAWLKDSLLSDQPLPVSVQVESPLQILVKQSAPSYETRQLKDFAATLGSEVLMNTDISKGKTITQTVNRVDATETSFSPTTLAASDWSIMDGRALTELAATQRKWLADAVQSGLGLLVLADDSLVKNFDKLSDNLLQGFSLSADSQVDEEVVTQLLGMNNARNELTLPALAARLATGPDHAPLNILVADSNGRALVAARSKGLGNVAVGLISQSYRWVTAGHRRQWSNYWASLSTALSRSANSDTLIAPADKLFFRVGERVQICALSKQSAVSARISVTNPIAPAEVAAPTPPELTQAEQMPGAQPIDLPLIADNMGSTRHCGWYWPTSGGWQNVELLSNETSQVLDSQSQYVWTKDQWPAQSRFERLQATRNKMALSASAIGQMPAQKALTEGLNTFWIWLLFITTASGLWLERKLDWNTP